LAAVAAVAVALVVGTYLVAVFDEVLGRLAAREPLGLLSAVTMPVRRSAMALLQSHTTTERPDGPAWALAVAALGGLGAVALVVVPLSSKATVADVDDGIVFFGAAMALVMVAVFLHGWSPNSALPLVGAYRFVAQALSYEMPIALVLIGVALPARSLAIGDIVQSQHDLWNVVRQPLGLPLYLVASAGLAFWGPLATPDAADVAGGTRAESSGSALLAWKLARATVLVAVAAMGAAAFLGGWWGPVLPQPAWMVLKTGALLVVLVGSGHLLARVRLERFVVVAWSVLIPLALLDVFQGGIVALVQR